MSALLHVVTSLCVSAPGSYSQACTSAVTASSQQSGVGKYLDTVERDTAKEAKSIAQDQLGDDGSKILAGSAYVINAAAQKKLIVVVPTSGWCSEMRTEIKSSLYELIVEWRF
jgi:hypothetical protein